MNVVPEPADTAAARRRRALAVVVAVAVAWNLIGNLVLPGAWYVPANLAVAAAVVAVARGAGLDAAELGLARADLRRGLRVGLLAVLVAGAMIGLALLVPAAESAFERSGASDDQTATRWFVSLVRIPLGTAVFEELLFRSALYGLILSLRGAGQAVVATSILFGLWHVVPAWETTEGSPAAVSAGIVGTVLITALGGVAFGLLRWWSRSVLAPILAHAATNSLAYVAALVAIESID